MGGAIGATQESVEWGKSVKRMQSYGVRVLFLVLVLGLAACSAEQKIQKHIQRAEAYAANEEYEEAVIEYRNALKLDPNHIDAHLALAKIYFKMSKTRDGHWELAEAIRLDPKRNDLRLEYGELSRRIEEYETALEQAEAVLATEPTNSEAWLVKARTLQDTKKPEAEQAYLKAIEATPKMAKYYLAAALYYSSLSNLKESEKMILAAVEHDPGYLSYTSMAAFLAAIPDRSKEAEAWWKKAIDSLREDEAEALIQGYTSLANYYWQQGNFSGLEQTLHRAIERFPKELSFIYLLARSYEVRGDDAKANELMESATKAVPDKVDPFLALSAYRHGRNDYEGAIDAMNQALKIDPKSVPTRLRLADLYFEKGTAAKDEALIGQGAAIVEAVLLEDENEPEALYLSAKLDLYKGKKDDAVRRLRRVVEARPGWAQAHFVLGTALLSQGDSAGARVALTRALEIDGSLVEARKALTQIYDRAGEGALSIEEARKVLRVNPQADDMRILLAQGLLRDGQSAEALKELEVIPEERRNVSVYYAIGRANFLLGKMDEARKYLLKANELAPNNSEVLGSLFRVDLATGRLADSVQRVEGAVKADPKSAGLAYLQGMVFGAAGREQDAIQALRRATELNPNLIDAYTELAKVYARAGKMDQVLKTFEEAAAATPNEPGIQLILGTLYEGLNEKAKARAAYEAAIRLNPNLAAAKNNLAFMLAEEGKELDRALTLAQEAKALVPNNPNIADTLGWVFYKKKLPSAAITYLKEAEQGFPSDDPALGSIRYHLALAYHANGESEKAKALLQLALENLEERRRAYRKKTGLEADVPEWAVDAEKLLTKLSG